MKKETESWRLTAFVLGELDPQEASAMQAAIDADPALRQECEELKSVVAKTRQILTKETVPLSLRPEQSEIIAKEIEARATGAIGREAIDVTPEVAVSISTCSRQSFSVRTLVGILATTAACGLAAFFLFPYAATRHDLVLKDPFPPPSIGSMHSIPKTSESSSSLGYGEGIAPLRTTPPQDAYFGTSMGGVPAQTRTDVVQEEVEVEAKQSFTFGFRDPSSLSAAPLPAEQSGVGEDRFRFSAGRHSDTALPPNRNERVTEKALGDRYLAIEERKFMPVQQQPLSTFSIDVDTATYAKIRQYLMQSNHLPQPESVRIEEMINYFDYEYEGPRDLRPFAANLALGPCPWNPRHRLIRIGLQAKKVEVKDRPKANLVFLLDVSGSMDEPNKLPLVKQTISMLVRQLGENDRLAIVVYAGAAGCVLPSITGDHQPQILAALEALHAGGSTNGGEGIQLAYSIAREHFIPGGINRVILCTDGDFNVGTTSTQGLVELVKDQARSKVFLTCLGYGVGNYNDAMMEQITNQGNGVYAMVDNALEARRIMVEQLSGTLMTVAKDVKIQVEFNPAKVASYRLIGYENRHLANEDFNNDRVDAGEIGAGHRVTALYEIAPVGLEPEESPVDPLRYRNQDPVTGTPPARTEAKEKDGSKSRPNDEVANEWMTLKLRYKEPEGDASTKLEFHLDDAAVERRGSETDGDFMWASAVAEFGLLLRHSQLAPEANWERMLERARQAAGQSAVRQECVEMMTRAKSLAGR